MDQCSGLVISAGLPHSTSPIPPHVDHSLTREGIMYRRTNALLVNGRSQVRASTPLFYQMAPSHSSATNLSAQRSTVCLVGIHTPVKRNLVCDHDP
jgi:hypothetical protein